VQSFGRPAYACTSATASFVSACVHGTSTFFVGSDACTSTHRVGSAFVPQFGSAGSHTPCGKPTTWSTHADGMMPSMRLVSLTSRWLRTSSLCTALSSRSLSSTQLGAYGIVRTRRSLPVAHGTTLTDHGHGVVVFSRTPPPITNPEPVVHGSSASSSRKVSAWLTSSNVPHSTLPSASG
jgi:hypothetical protein